MVVVVTKDYFNYAPTACLCIKIEILIDVGGGFLYVLGSGKGGP